MMSIRPSPLRDFAPLEEIFVCAQCRSPLLVSATEAECSSCGHKFYKRDGTWDLIIGDRFPDEQDGCRWEKEELQDRHRADHYMAPLFRSVQEKRGDGPLRLLSVGCGVGAEVDRLIDGGFECYGIDCGNRTAVWSRRQYPDKLLLANGNKLPFCDGYFDVVFAGCVFHTSAYSAIRSRSNLTIGTTACSLPERW